MPIQKPETIGKHSENRKKNNNQLKSKE